MNADVKYNNFIKVKGLCRLCLTLTDSSESVSIFDESDSLTSEMKIRIEDCLSLTVSENDGLPPNICGPCARKLTELHDFKKNAQRSDYNLRQILQAGPLQAMLTPGCEAKFALLLKEEEWEGNQKLAAEETVPDASVSNPEEDVNEGDVDDEDDDDEDDDDIPLSVMIKKEEDGATKQTKVKKKKSGQKTRTPRVKPFCMKCNIKYTTFAEYYAHQRDSHGLSEEVPSGVEADAFAMYRCHICKDDFQNRETLREHCKSSHNVRVIHPYGCNHCDRQFPSWGLLVVHERQHTGEKPYSCDLCGKENFISQASLRRHKLMHLKLFSCNECGRDFNCDSALKAHIRCKHTNEKPFLCNVCGRRFSLATILNAHMTSHSSERKYRCEICGFASKTSGNHHRHKARHNQGGVKSFHCATCGKAFETKLKLSSHQIIHRPVRPHACKHCGKAFLYNNKLERHVLLVHARERPYPCHLCGRKLASKFGLGIHLKTHFKTDQQQMPENSIPMQDAQFFVQ